MDLEVPENDAAVLRTLVGLREDEPLPEKLEAKYHELYRICLRDGCQAITRSELHMLVFSQGYGKPLQRESHPTIVDLWLAGKVKRESQVIVKWRNGEKGGVLKRVDFQNRCIVQMDGDTEERPFEADKVRVAETVAA